ncbi:DUF3149 domain-containing protein, partial [bacterium]|nr:DUF3149 domain-containing protein [bacterium]
MKKGILSLVVIVLIITLGVWFFISFVKKNEEKKA